MQRDVFLEVLRDSYSAYYDIIPPEDGDGLLAFRADYFSRDEKYWVTKSIKIWGNEKNEFAYIFSAPEFDAAAIDACVSARWTSLCRGSSPTASTSTRTSRSCSSRTASARTRQSTLKS